MIDLSALSIPMERIDDEPVFAFRPFARAGAATGPTVGAWLTEAGDTSASWWPTAGVYADSRWGVFVLTSLDVWHEQRAHFDDRLIGSGVAIVDPTYLELATTFSAYLGRLRSTPPPVIGERRSEGSLRLSVPHFVLTRKDGVLSDTVLWESSTKDVLDDVFRTDTRGIEEWWPHIQAIVELRSRLRAGGVLPAEVDALRAVMRVERRYLSFRFILERADLVRSALDALGNGARC